MNRDTHRFEGRRAFTLLEVVIAVGLVIALAALLFPLSAKMEESAKMVKCSGNLRQLVAGWRLYCADHNGVSVKYYWAQIPSNFGYPFWVGQIAPYTSGDIQTIALCPAAATPTDASNYSTGTATNCWAWANWDKVIRCSYGFHGLWYSEGTPEIIGSMPPVKNALSTDFIGPVFADSAWVDSSWGVPVPDNFDTGLRWVVARHKHKGINIAFSDGSVRFTTIGEYYRDIPMFPGDVVPHNDAQYQSVPAQYR